MNDRFRNRNRRSVDPAAIEQRVYDTEEQIRSFKKETSEQIARLGIDTHTQIAELRQDSKVQIMALRRESREDLGAFRGEVKQSLEHIADKLDIQLTRSADNSKVNWSAILGSFAGLGALLISFFGVIGSLAKAPIDAELIRLGSEIKAVTADMVPRSEIKERRAADSDRFERLQLQTDRLAQTSARADSFAELRESLKQASEIQKAANQHELNRMNAEIRSLQAAQTDKVKRNKTP